MQLCSRKMFYRYSTLIRDLLDLGLMSRTLKTLGICRVLAPFHNPTQGYCTVNSFSEDDWF